MRATLVAFLCHLSLVPALAEKRTVLKAAISPAASHWKRSARLASNQAIHIDLALATASERYSLPSRVARYIDYVLPAPDPDPVSSAPQSVAVPPKSGIGPRQIREIDCLQYTAPQCLRQLAWVAEDLDMFFRDFAPDLLLPFNLEPNLDYEYTMALAKPIPVTNIQVGDPVVQGNLNIMLAAFNAHYCRTGLDPEFDPVYPNPAPGGYNATDCGTHVPPRVVAIMYAWNEAWYTDVYARRQCLEFLKLGLQGQGLFASVFPASCPWVTSVGGTQFLPVNVSDDSSSTSSPSSFPGETALDNNGTVSSGGGFSRLFPAPWYQGNLTREYLASAPGAAELARQGYFDGSGRGYPDISAMADSFLVALHGGYRAVSGTSASTPVVAAMVAKINNARLHAGKSTVGFLNPVLYSAAARKAGVLRDVQDGKNHGCGVDEAFPARRAWDAVTGLGTPDFKKLKELYLRLP
ncbi:peptidase S8/S53 domain-containing protein [Sordaria brevicollis]|uniref:Peptidase S8/S53 domain-containing protein n=1 Tax=Sordaria brevicollis TaxID=83679 RepID=A0AAE0U5W3_SORBR|nr:peptidase S8/S53 domain-containing protein [Sordaria brevicollis]